MKGIDVRSHLQQLFLFYMNLHIYVRILMYVMIHNDSQQFSDILNIISCNRIRKLKYKKTERKTNKLQKQLISLNSFQFPWPYCLINVDIQFYPTKGLTDFKWNLTFHSNLYLPLLMISLRRIWTQTDVIQSHKVKIPKVVYPQQVRQENHLRSSSTSFWKYG